MMYFLLLTISFANGGQSHMLVKTPYTQERCQQEIRTATDQLNAMPELKELGGVTARCIPESEVPK